MERSWKSGTYAGVGMFVHRTFALFLAWVIGVYLANGSGWPVAGRKSPDGVRILGNHPGNGQQLESQADQIGPDRASALDWHGKCR